MGVFLSYSIFSGLLMLAMYLAYRVFLSRDNQHGFNRGVLLCIYALSFLTLPLINALDTATAHSAVNNISFEAVESTGSIIEPSSRPVWGTILIWIFIAGMIAAVTRTIITWIRLTNVIRTGQKIEKKGYTLVITDTRQLAPFSWMRYMVIGREDYKNNPAAIATHELKHIAAYHWIDLLIAQAVCIINWFNPAAWLMRDELMLIHEYQADMAVIESGIEPQEYQMLLIKKAVGARFPSLANSLNHSKLKKRITMMYQEKSGAGRKFKALALVPVLALAIGVSFVPAVRAAATTISNSEISVGKDKEKSHKGEVSVRRFKVVNINDDGIQTTVTINGENLGDHLTVSGGTFTNNRKTYQANSLSTQMANGSATITLSFPFTGEYKKGKMAIRVNGDEIPFDLEEFSNNSQAVVIGDNDDVSKASTTIVINSHSSKVPEEIKILLDGKEISRSVLSTLNSDTIGSITIDRDNNIMKITSRK